MLSKDYVEQLTKEQYAKNLKCTRKLYNLVDLEDSAQNAYLNFLVYPKELSFPKTYTERAIVSHIFNANRHNKLMEPITPENSKAMSCTFEESVEVERAYSHNSKIIAKMMKVLKHKPTALKVIKLELEGKKPREIAKELGIAYNTVKAHRRQAHELLREYVKGAKVCLY